MKRFLPFLLVLLYPFMIFAEGLGCKDDTIYQENINHQLVRVVTTKCTTGYIVPATSESLSADSLSTIHSTIKKKIMVDLPKELQNLNEASFYAFVYGDGISISPTTIKSKQFLPWWQPDYYATYAKFSNGEIVKYEKPIASTTGGFIAIGLFLLAILPGVNHDRKLRYKGDSSLFVVVLLCIGVIFATMGATDIISGSNYYSTHVVWLNGMNLLAIALGVIMSLLISKS